MMPPPKPSDDNLSPADSGPQAASGSADLPIAAPPLSIFGRIQGRLTGAIAFYTILPIPESWPLAFDRIASFAPLVGVMLGVSLGALDWGLGALGMPLLTRSVLVVLVGIALTGGLHLDGAMDSADGLAVLDPERRLTVMADSATGAFGAMAAIAILGLKIAALSELNGGRWVTLMAIAGWGRWGQVVAIARYPYLKAEGKGAFHKAAIRPGQDWIPGVLLLGGVSALAWVCNPDAGGMALGMGIGGAAIALSSAAWFNDKLGGHTGDTYGAVVEWTEALLLALLTMLQP
ncbi:MAG: adenosylcobinamide-GDP ribazoletransferase [Cyanobacteria bacterium J06635_15]